MIHFPYLAITLICEGKERFDFDIPTQIRLGLILPLVCAETLIDINRFLFSFRVNTRQIYTREFGTQREEGWEKNLFCSYPTLAEFKERK